jgi:hypothetical protein
MRVLLNLLIALVISKITIKCNNYDENDGENEKMTKKIRITVVEDRRIFLNFSSNPFYDYKLKNGLNCFFFNLKIINFNKSISEECFKNRNYGVVLKRVNFTQKWYYNNKLRKCIQFPYSGIGGNSNNFDNCQDCLSRCFRVKKRFCFF